MGFLHTLNVDLARVDWEPHLGDEPVKHPHMGPQLPAKKQLTFIYAVWGIYPSAEAGGLLDQPAQVVS